MIKNMQSVEDQRKEILVVYRKCIFIYLIKLNI